MRIFYSQGSDPLIAASRSEMRAVSSALSDFLISEKDELYIAADANESAEPYQVLLKGLRLVKDRVPICISIEAEGELKVEGEVSELMLWVKAFHFPESAADGDHHHPESRADIRVQPGSLSTIVEVYEPE
ncbi:MAG: hypothetical protein AB1724_12090 [Thermodesulfobacteriota bacterium]